jgi:hypothetical protein
MEATVLETAKLGDVVYWYTAVPQQSERSTMANAEHEACDAWWATTGCEIWRCRQEVKGPFEALLTVIQFVREGDEQVALVLVTERKTEEGTAEVVVRSCGFRGREYSNGDRFISPYATTGESSGPTLQMALYRLTR